MNDSSGSIGWMWFQGKQIGVMEIFFKPKCAHYLIHRFQRELIWIFLRFFSRSNLLILLTYEPFRSFRKFFFIFAMKLTVSLNSLIKQSMARLNGNFSTFFLPQKYKTFKWNILWKNIELNYNEDTILDGRVHLSSKFGCAQCGAQWLKTKEKHNAFWLQIKRNEMKNWIDSETNSLLWTLLFYHSNHQYKKKKIKEISFQVLYLLVSHTETYLYCKEVIIAWVSSKRNWIERILKHLCVYICELHCIVENTR